MIPGSANKIWRVRSYDRDTAITIAQALGICENTAALLCQRGVKTPDEANIFLKKESCCFYDPFLLKDMDKAVERIIKAINGGEKVCVYGDYDVDGITATSLMCSYLSSKGVECDHYIPKRSSEGYGVNYHAIESIVACGVSLIITVDTGVTAIDEIEKAKGLGVDFVVTDHHECKDVIPDTTVVNPCRHDCDYPYKSLAGVGVVFKVICAIEMALAGKTDGVPTDILKSLLSRYGQLVALGTVADVMPATDENRLIISVGLSMMQREPEPWCKAILDYYGFYGNNGKDKKQITTSTIGYIIAPRINAAGRIGDTDLAVNLFMARSKEQTEAYAAELCELNRKRQHLENEILDEALEMIKNEPEDDPFIILSSDSWNQGIIGIVASRLSEKFSKPCILVTFCDEDNLDGKGSGRSANGINIYEALEYCKDLLIKYGGHELAAGLTLERKDLPAFKQKINEYTRKVMSEKKTATVIEIDREISGNEINLNAASELRLLEPFGYGNPSPVFLITDAVISDIAPLGNDKHCKFNVTKDEYTFQCVYFGTPQSQLGFCPGDTVDMIFSMEVNNYNNNERLQLIVKDMRRSEALEAHVNSQLSIYEDICNGEPADSTVIEEIIPTREDFKAVYLYVLRMLGRGINTIKYPFEARKLSLGRVDCPISVCKFRLILDIFREKELICYKEIDRETLQIEKSDKITPGEKVSLDGSLILSNLRDMKKQA